jgi:hypothetical protein
MKQNYLIASCPLFVTELEWLDAKWKEGWLLVGIKMCPMFQAVFYFVKLLEVDYNK